MFYKVIVGFFFDLMRMFNINVRVLYIHMYVCIYGGMYVPYTEVGEKGVCFAKIVKFLITLA